MCVEPTTSGEDTLEQYYTNCVYVCCTARQEDDEAVLCIVCTFCQLITHDEVKIAIAKIVIMKTHLYTNTTCLHSTTPLDGLTQQRILQETFSETAL